MFHGTRSVSCNLFPVVQGRSVPCAPFLSCKNFPKRHCSFNLLHSRLQSVKNDRLEDSKRRKSIYFFISIDYMRYKATRTPHNQRNAFHSETYRMKHKTSKNGSVVALRGYHDFNKKWEQVHPLPLF